jgi:hypothetical protein
MGSISQPISPIFEQNAVSQVVGHLELQAFQWEDCSTIQAFTEWILTTMTTSGLSRTASSATIQGQLKGCPTGNCDESCRPWCLDMMPKPKQEFGYRSEIENALEQRTEKLTIIERYCCV